MTTKERKSGGRWQNFTTFNDVFISRMGGIDKVIAHFPVVRIARFYYNLCRVLYPNILAVFCSTGNVPRNNTIRQRTSKKGQIYCTA